MELLFLSRDFFQQKSSSLWINAQEYFNKLKKLNIGTVSFFISIKLGH